MPEVRNADLMLIGIFTAAWLLVFFGTVLIFEFIVPLNITSHYLLNGIVKGFLATILVVVWLFLFVQMRDYMIKTQLKLEKKKVSA